MKYGLLRISALVSVALAGALAGCTETGASQGIEVTAVDSDAPDQTRRPAQVFWGDTHLHTINSTDAYGFGNRLTAEDALRFAKGDRVISSTGVEAQLSRPLDFLMIADHAEGFGLTTILRAEDREQLSDPLLTQWWDIMHDKSASGFTMIFHMLEDIPPYAKEGKYGVTASVEQRAKSAGTYAKTAWTKHGKLVDQYNDPGNFTAFIGFEYSPNPNSDNLHRVVMFRDGAQKTNQTIPFSALGSSDPETLWAYLAAYEDKSGGRVLAIPHNSNLSGGRMFAMQKMDGSELDAAYVKTRARWEPVVEATQIKGDSESHPFLSPNDEFASFGDVGWERANLGRKHGKRNETLKGDYVREGLKNGLLLERKMGANPFKLGMIGSTDSHTGLATADENNFLGKYSANEGNPKRALTEVLPGRSGWNLLSSGYAAVWATSNTREAIFDAIKRREVYATTGPRMTVRFFGSFEFAEKDAGAQLVSAGYGKGVPMGGDLTGGQTTAPNFLVSALMDPDGANLDRVQIVKGWVDADGRTREKIYDVTWSDEKKRKLGSGGKLGPVGNTVNLKTAKYSNGIGAPELVTYWQDPDFDPSQHAFYYVRVLEIPTPSWPLLDAVKYGFTLPEDAIAVHQERAYTSPIWYTPS